MSVVDFLCLLRVSEDAIEGVIEVGPEVHRVFQSHAESQ